MLPVSIAKQTTEKFATGQGTANGTAAAITASKYNSVYGVFIRNHDTTNAVYVGTSTVATTSGFKVTAEQDVWIPVDDPTSIYVVTAGASVAFSFLVV